MNRLAHRIGTGLATIAVAGMYAIVFGMWLRGAA